MFSSNQNILKNQTSSIIVRIKKIVALFAKLDILMISFNQIHVMQGSKDTKELLNMKELENWNIIKQREWQKCNQENSR